MQWTWAGVPHHHWPNIPWTVLRPSMSFFSFFPSSGFSVNIFIANAWTLQLPKRESMQLIHTARLGCILSAFITVLEAERHPVTEDFLRIQKSERKIILVIWTGREWSHFNNDAHVTCSLLWTAQEPEFSPPDPSLSSPESPTSQSSPGA